jgi:uncharacterized Tic20 family protein
MIDTTMIDYGINKLQSAFVNIQPKIEGLTQQYIEYTVLMHVISHLLCFISLLLCGLIWIPVYKYGRNKGSDHTNFDENGFQIPTAVLGIISVGLLIVSMSLIPETILAIKFPEMFTINSFIK